MTDLDKIKSAREELGKLEGSRKWACLVVDDDEADKQELSGILKKQFNCDTSTAGCCMEGMAKMSLESFDYVFMDIVMPAINGLECFDLIRARQPNAKVIFASGLNENFSGVRKCLANGALR